MKTLILGKRSFLSERLKNKLNSSIVLNFAEFEKFIFLNKKKFNLIINSFYPSSKLNNLYSYSDFYSKSIGKLCKVLDKIDPKNINKIIYTSSASIYGSINEAKFKDDNNRYLYSSTKLLSEVLMSNFCQKKRVQLIIARVFNMYGPNDNFSIINKLIEAKKNKNKIIINNDGNTIRDFIHVDNVCEIYSKLLKSKDSFTLDVGSGFGTKIKDLINFIKIPKNRIIFKKELTDEINYSIANINEIDDKIKKIKFYKLENFLQKKIKLKKKLPNLKKIEKDYPNTINNYLRGSVIYGCGFAGKKIAEKLIRLNKNNISFFVDDNPKLIGKAYFGKKIISIKNLLEIAKKKIISNIIIAIPSMPYEKLMKLYTKLYPLTLNITALPNKRKLIKKNKVAIEDLKNLELGDILKRKIFDIDKNSIKNFSKKIVMVTGGAGSIGSEISRQILRSNPKKLLIVDNSEYNLFKLKQELGLKKNIRYLLLDVLNENQIKHTIKENNIHYIFHSAAYKHVNILEKNLVSAIKNNIMATVSLLNAIKNTKINLTVISTDKAVKPKNILGITKRVSEIITLSTSNLKEYKKTNLSVVRFGNVFGSSGSAIEIFKNQIQYNLPITLTDKKMTRYFMSIREACNLVLQSSQLKNLNSIFVLDMGRPIKIIDIIKKIHQRFNKNNELNIKMIGKNKAEKLNERLTTNKLKPTSLKNINFVKDKIVSVKNIEKFLGDLDTNINKFDEKKLLFILKKFILKNK